MKKEKWQDVQYLYNLNGELYNNVESGSEVPSMGPRMQSGKKHVRHTLMVPNSKIDEPL
jgi:hypothetical protein